MYDSVIIERKSAKAIPIINKEDETVIKQADRVSVQT